MGADDLPKALLVEEVATPRTVAEALFASVTGGVPLVQALVDTGATDAETLARYVARTDVPFLKQVVPVAELVERLPRGLCARLLALPVRQDPLTGTVDVVVADPADPHAASEVSYHLGAPVRVVRAALPAIEEALRRLRIRARQDAPADRFREAAARAAAEDDAYGGGHSNAYTAWPSQSSDRPGDQSRSGRRASLPPAEPALWGAVPEARDVPPRRGGLVIEADSAPPPAAPPMPGRRIRTPPWGTPVHAVPPTNPPTEPPQSGYGSEIPIPLTRKTFTVVAGGTQRPPAFLDPRASALGEGYSFDPSGFRAVVEKSVIPRVDGTTPIAPFIPGPPPLPSAAPPPPDLASVLVGLRTAVSRDEVLELVLIGALTVAPKVALFVVKKGGYHGWAGSPELGDRAQVQSVFLPLDSDSVFDQAVREDLYLGPLRADPVHTPLLRILKTPTRDVAAVPIKVAGKTAVLILADELGDTMNGTRRLEELARAAGEAFGRIVRARAGNRT